MQHLTKQPDKEDYNLVLSIAKPAARPETDLKIFGAMDQFLRHHDKNPLHTVAETIFPFALYRRHGVKGVYTMYPEDVYPAIKKLPEVRWGTYAHRLVRWPMPDGRQFNQLERLVEKIKNATSKNKKPYTAAYELATDGPEFSYDPAKELEEEEEGLRLYDPKQDAGPYYGGQCLSHVSVKVKDGASIILTAIYRSHYYIEKALGNLVGLSHLQAFICNETGLEPGELGCVSTYALMDTGSSKSGKAWGATKAATLASDIQKKLEGK